MPSHAALSVIQYYILSKLVSDSKEYLALTQQLTGPRLTTMAKRIEDATRLSDEPPTPLWWDDDDEDVSEMNFAAAKQLGVTLQT